MREVRIRTWNGEVFDHHKPATDDPIMLWTGVQDKHGNDIYEGDIVTAWSQGYQGTFEVRWRLEGSPCYILWPAYQNNEYWYLFGEKDTGIEIIGNIYETPHLRPRVEGL